MRGGFGGRFWKAVLGGGFGRRFCKAVPDGRFWEAVPSGRFCEAVHGANVSNSQGCGTKILRPPRMQTCRAPRRKHQLVRLVCAVAAQKVDV